MKAGVLFMFVRKKQQELFRQDIDRLETYLKEIKAMLDFKIHSDYLNKTGRVLAAPWDELEQPETSQPAQGEENSDLDSNELKTILQKFISVECKQMPGATTSFKAFFNAFQTFYLQNYDEVSLPAISVRDVMEVIQREEKWFTIMKDVIYRYKGLALKDDKDLAAKSPVQMFLDERCEFNQDYSIKASEFNDKLDRFCQDKALPRFSASQIKQEMEGFQSAYHFKRVKRSNYMYVGLKVREQEN